jgi:hypothetical protein
MKMKNLKRVFSMALATMMAVGMLSTSAYAETVDTDGISDTHVDSISVSKTVEVSKNGTLLPDSEFEITMVPATAEQLLDSDNKPITDSTNGIKIQAGHALKTDTLTFKFDASDSTDTGSVTKEQAFKFEFNNSYTSTGVYRYYVTEKSPLTDSEGNTIYENGYITYDETKYTVDLYIKQDSKSGKFMVSTFVLTQVGKAEKPPKISFTNKIKCSDLKIYKKISTTTTEYTSGELYTFRILIPVGGETIDLKDGQVLTAYLRNGKGTVIDTENKRTDSDGKISIKVGGDDLNADMKKYASTFKLKADEFLDIVGVPVTMVYTVEEVVDDASVNASGLSLVDEGYTTTYTYAAYGDNDTGRTNVTDKNGSSVTGTINTVSNEVTFTNTRTMTPPTGINLDMLPYVLLTLIAVCGGILFINRKRRADR